MRWLLARREHKFLIHDAKLEPLRAMILPHVQVDPYAVSRVGNEYTVRSLYLDTGGLECYHEKLAGIRERLKVRIRAYNEISGDTPVFLELKKKIGGAVMKRRSVVQHQDLPAFLETGDVDRFIQTPNHSGAAQETARQFLFQYHARGLGPVITVVYEREPYFSKIDQGLRITLDKQLRADYAGSLDALAGRDGGTHALPHRFILEIKTDLGVPLWLQMVLSRLDAHRESVSKYAICIDSLRATGCRFHEMSPLTVQGRQTFFQSRA